VLPLVSAYVFSPRPPSSSRFFRLPNSFLFIVASCSNQTFVNLPRKFSVRHIFAAQTASTLPRYRCTAHILCIAFARVTPRYHLFYRLCQKFSSFASVMPNLSTFPRFCQTS
jgi:hypothetical protein